MRTNVYIDSFNLYYGCLKGTPYRWLDLDALCRRLLPKNRINRIRFFTARVKSRPSDPQQAQRQQIYFRALQTIPHLSIHYGQFITKPVSMPLHTPPPSGSKFAIVMKTEEKGSDVNLATYLLLDGFKEDYEAAVVISGDTDLLEPIRVVRQELGLTVGVLNPHPRRSAELSRAASFYKPLDPGDLPHGQFPPTLTDAIGVFTKPAGW
jgi:uncharacterized LabA/DUF88 family protein